MTHARWHHRGSDAGVMAVIVALSAVTLFSVAALSVDLGNAYSRKRDVQSQADFAAFAAVKGGLNLPATHPNPLASDDAVIQAAAYLNRNQPQNDATGMTNCQYTKTCVTAAQLVNKNNADGEVYYGQFTGSHDPVPANFVPSLNEITVVAPQAQVNFGLAKAIPGIQPSTAVQASATVAIKSARLKTVPFYAFTTCDYGPQTISEPNNGHSADPVLLSHASEPSPANTNTGRVTSLLPTQVPLNDTAARLQLNGTNLSGVTDIGFFESGNSSAGPEPKVVTNLPASNFTITGTTKIVLNVALPSSVSSVEGVWYLRVKKGGQWSSVDYVGELTVGSPVLTCGQGSNSGNFGTLKLQGTGQATEIAENIAKGPDVELARYPTPGNPATFLCQNNVNGGRMWPQDPTNCVGTKPGMAQNAATSGFVTGGTGDRGPFNGLLTNVAPGTGCAANGAPATRPFGSKTINNDTLTCFLTDTTTNVGQIDNATYALPGPVLSTAIWSSPRLIFVPVLGVQPGNGASKDYQIIDFRPAFVTDQTNSATKNTVATAYNGLTPSGSDVQSVQVVFINAAALPPPPGNVSLTDYIPGSTSKIVRLIN